MGKHSEVTLLNCSELRALIQPEASHWSYSLDTRSAAYVAPSRGVSCCEILVPYGGQRPDHSSPAVSHTGMLACGVASQCSPTVAVGLWHEVT